MASVVITSTIRSEVRQKITNMFSKRIETKLAELNKLGIGEYIFESQLSPEDCQLVAKLNESKSGTWVQPSIAVNVACTYINAQGKADSYAFRVTFRPPVPLPLKMANHSYTFKLDSTHGEIHTKASTVLSEWSILNAEREKLIATLVNGVLTQCKSLRQVLEVWPNAMEFMPEYVCTRHAERVTKRERSVPDITIDDDTKASLIKARMVNL